MYVSIMCNSPISRKCMYVGNMFYLVANEVSENKGGSVHLVDVEYVLAKLFKNLRRAKYISNLFIILSKYGLVGKGGRKTFVVQTHRPYCFLNYKSKDIVQPQIKSRIR